MRINRRRAKPVPPALMIPGIEHGLPVSAAIERLGSHLPGIGRIDCCIYVATQTLLTAPELLIDDQVSPLLQIADEAECDWGLWESIVLRELDRISAQLVGLTPGVVSPRLWSQMKIITDRVWETASIPADHPVRWRYRNYLRALVGHRL